MPPTQLGLDRDIAIELLQTAVLAPSSHNIQPWIFRLGNSQIDILADRTLALPVNDPDDRELTVSCSCALFNLRVAAAHAGMALNIHLLPDPKNADLLASVQMASSGKLPSDIAALWDAVTQRRTYRRVFLDRPVSQAHVVALTKAAKLEQARLHCIEEYSACHAIAALVAEGDAVQWANPSWRRELAMWMHPCHQNDGLAFPWLLAPVAQAVVRTFDMGDGVGAKDHQLADASPLLAVISTDGDNPEHWLLAGQALQHVLLVACRLGLQASYLNQAIQVPALRPKLQHLIGQPGFPQILLRLGYPKDELPASPRRPLVDVIDAR
jgi:nitroreductase